MSRKRNKNKIKKNCQKIYVVVSNSSEHILTGRKMNLNLVIVQYDEHEYTLIVIKIPT